MPNIFASMPCRCSFHPCGSWRTYDEGIFERCVADCGCTLFPCVVDATSQLNSLLFTEGDNNHEPPPAPDAPGDDNNEPEPAPDPPGVPNRTNTDGVHPNGWYYGDGRPATDQQVNTSQANGGPADVKSIKVMVLNESKKPKLKMSTKQQDAVKGFKRITCEEAAKLRLEQQARKRRDEEVGQA